VRHGQSTWNEQGRIQGSSNLSVLTSKGEGQAEITRKILQVRISCCYLTSGSCIKRCSSIQFLSLLPTRQGKYFDTGFRSPLARASRTADVVWSSRPPELIDLWELREIDLFSFEGLLKHEGEEKYGDVYTTWKTNPANFEIDGKFPVRELWERGTKCWETILKAEGTDILVVAHNAVNQAVVAHALGLGPACFRRLAQSNCGLTTFTCIPSHGAEPAGFVLEQLNQTPAPPLHGNTVLVCAFDGSDEEIAPAIATAFGAESVDCVLCDNAASSSSLARDVATLLRWETPTRSSGSLIDFLKSPGTTVMFAESYTIDFVVGSVLQLDEGLGSRLRLTPGGFTIIDFDGDVDDYSATIACLNYTAHLSELE